MTSPPVGMDVVLARGRPPVAHVGTGLSGADWLAEHRTAVHDVVRTHGAVVLRGLDVVDVPAFGDAARRLIGEPMIEREAFAPRDHHPGGIYSAPKWPADQPMCPRNELSYAVRFPRLLLLGCLAAAQADGATVLADTRRVLAELPADLVDRADRLGWELRRNHHEDVGVDLADVFGGTTDEWIRDYCLANDIDHDRGGAGQVRTRQRRPALLRHPITGERCWFNQLGFLNAGALDPDVREYLVAMYGPDSLPFDTRWGDGEVVAAEDVEAINRCCEDVAVRVSLRAGDLLLMDNVLTAHGRDPVLGPQRLLVAMGAPVTRSDLDRPTT